MVHLHQMSAQRHQMIEELKVRRASLKGRAAVEALDREELVVRALFAYDAYKVPI